MGHFEAANLARNYTGAGPFSRPNNSLSMNVAGIAAQLTFTMGRGARRLSSWIAEATISFPVPVSPIQENGCGGPGDLSGMFGNIQRLLQPLHGTMAGNLYSLTTRADSSK
jgi:hypothetical protein